MLYLVLCENVQRMKYLLTTLRALHLPYSTATIILHYTVFIIFIILKEVGHMRSDGA